MSKHTPGPFVITVVDHGPNGLEYIIRQECQSGDGIIIAQNVNREDRYLIAAAPDMLDALEHVMLMFEDLECEGLKLKSTRMRVKSAIAKARRGIK